jgi:hypothetical protein
MAHAARPNGGLNHAKYGAPLSRQQNGPVFTETGPDLGNYRFDPQSGRRLSAREQRAKSRNRKGRKAFGH